MLKAEKALELIQKINDKVIIFTEYRATQLYLQWFLKQHGISSVPFRGGFKRGKKDWMRELFQKSRLKFLLQQKLVEKESTYNFVIILLTLICHGIR